LVRSRTLRLLLVTTVLWLCASAAAAASLKLGTVLPGWDELRSGNLHSAATRLVGDYSAQVRHFCVQPEVFMLAARSLPDARSAYEATLPSASRQRLLVDAADQRVTMVMTPTSTQEVMAVLALTDGGVVLILC